MVGFVLQRALQSVFVMLAITLIAFSLFRFVGDPLESMLGQDAAATDRARLRGELGLDDGIAVQVARFIGRAMQGDFGLSYQQARPVGRMILERLPATLELSLAAAALALALGIPLGVHAALNRESLASQIILALSLAGISLPTFLIGILLILLFSTTLEWLPSYGRGGVVMLGWWSTGLLTIKGLKSLILPATTLALFQAALILRLVRAEMITVLRSDFIKFARARGLGRRAINFGHALRNTLVPVITIVGLQLGSAIAFAVITETVFQWPGLGLMFIQAVTVADMPVMAAYLVLVGGLFVLINFTVDLLYYLVDPRLRVDRGAVRPI